MHSNKKLWMTGELHSLLKTQDTAFRDGAVSAPRTARNNLARVIRRAKRKHTVRISDNFDDSRNPTHLWQGIQAITDYKAPIHDCDNDPSLPGQLKDIFAQFEATNITSIQKATPRLEEHTPHLTPSSVKRALICINPTRPLGRTTYLDGSSETADQLKEVFTDIFNTYLLQSVVPQCLKSATITPVPKKSPVSCLNGYHPIAYIAYIIMKCSCHQIWIPINMHIVQTDLLRTL